MAIIQTTAAATGVVTGGYVLAGVYLFGVGNPCFREICLLPAGYPNYLPEIVEFVAVGLILGSLIGFVGPRRVFYASAALGALLGAMIVLSSSLTAPVILAVVLNVVTVATSVAAARWEPGVSEQSHPMNLPVFG